MLNIRCVWSACSSFIPEVPSPIVIQTRVSLIFVLLSFLHRRSFVPFLWGKPINPFVLTVIRGERYDRFEDMSGCKTRFHSGPF